MGKVAVTFRIMPTGLDVDLGSLSGRVRKALGGSLRRIEEKPIAFGLKALQATVLLDDAEGGTYQAEATLRDLDGVESVEATDVTIV